MHIVQPEVLLGQEYAGECIMEVLQQLCLLDVVAHMGGERAAGVGGTFNSWQ